MRVKILIIRVQPPSHCFLSLEIMSGAAAHLLKLLECYARQPRPLPCAMCKISPSALPSRDRSYEYAYSAQKLLENLPLCVEELAVSMEEQESLLLLARTLSQYLQQHGLRTGGKGGEGFAGTRCAFIAWVIASVFSTFAETTEEVWGRDTLRVAWTNVEAVANSPLHNRRWEAISEHIREDMRTNEAYKLPWNARDAFDACFGVEGEDLDPLTVEPDLFEQFFLSCVDPILDRFSDAARPISEVIGELAGAIDFDTLRSHLTRQFGYIPFSPEGGALLAVAATASSNAPLMFLVKRYLAECYSVLDTLDNHGLCSRTNESRRHVHWFNTELLHAFALVHEAVQVIPTCWHLGALGWDAESICRSGCWIPVKEGSKHLYHQLRPSNTTVVSPGLSIAATAVSGGGGAPGETAERALTTGTVLLSPPQDEARLFLSQVELSTYISRTSVDDGLSVAIVPIESFRMVEVLLLFQDLPPADAERVDVERLTLASLNAWLNNEAQSGIVIIAVTNHIDKTAMRQIEEWGSSARQVVVVGSIGEWAMSQLVLAFATMPNCGRTCLSSLRAVRRRASTRLYALDEVTYRYPSTNGADLHERLTRIVVLVAQIPEADGDGQVNSMLDGSDSDDSDASISSMGTDGRGSTLSDIIDESGIPLYPTVTMSVLLGGATPASQQLALYTFREAQRYVTHRVVLPGPMGSVVPGDGTVELALVNALRSAKYDQLCGMNEEDTPDESQGPAEEIVELRKRYQRTRALFFSRIGKALETAIWHFQILATQHQCDSSPESAWEECTSRMQEQCIQHPESESFQTSIGKLCEPYFSARDAYVIIGKCLDQLCRTVIVGRRTPVQEGSGFDTKGEPRGAELFLHPTIE